MPFDVEADVQAAIGDFQFNYAGFAEVVRVDGMIDLVKRAIRVQNSAKQYASGHSGGPNVRTGRLRGSITWRPGFDAISPYVDIGSNVLYAPYVELGTERMRARPYLRPALEAARVA